MESVITVDPFRCRVWHLHNRLDEHINERSCSAEIESFSEYGQLVPVLGRRVHDDSGCDIELIYGARRLFVARHICKPLLVELRQISDKEAIVAMDMENRQRQDISPYERGLSYARWLRGGFFASQDELAASLKISASQVSRLLKLSRLPSVVVSAFQSAVDICEGWGLQLLEALDEPANRPAVLHKAREIASSERKPPAREVYKQLLSATTPGRKPRRRACDTVVKDEQGSPLFRIRHQRDSIVLLLPITKVSMKKLSIIQREVKTILSGAPAAESPLEAVHRPAAAPRSQGLGTSLSAV